MWASPKYCFRVRKDRDGDGVLKEICIDVTRSAPPFSEPSDAMKSALSRVQELIAHKREPAILDVGAGKLRNTIYLLRNCPKSRLWAVEYEDLRSSMDQARKMYPEAEGFRKRFSSVIFPHEFLGLRQDFDLILLMNVVGIMPIPAERLFLLRCCFKRLKIGSFLLWYSQHNEGDYAEGGPRCNNKTRLGDGYHIGTKKYRTFYRDFSPEEVDQHLLASGFRLSETIPAGHNLARIYQKEKTSVFASLMDTKSIENITLQSDTIGEPSTKIKFVNPSSRTPLVIPNPPEFEFEELCIALLQKLPSGKRNATQFHRLSELILRRVFQYELGTFVIEQELDEGIKRVDIIAKNHAAKGFFRRLDNSYHIPSPNIFIECKNYSEDPANQEVDQLAQRLRPNRGMFGFLVYRHSQNRGLLRKRCKALVSENKYVIDLDDADVIKLLRFRSEEGLQEINEMLEKRLDLLTL